MIWTNYSNNIFRKPYISTKQLDLWIVSHLLFCTNCRSLRFILKHLFSFLANICYSRYVMLLDNYRFSGFLLYITYIVSYIFVYQRYKKRHVSSLYISTSYFSFYHILASKWYWHHPCDACFKYNMIMLTKSLYLYQHKGPLYIS